MPKFKDCPAGVGPVQSDFGFAQEILIRESFAQPGGIWLSEMPTWS